jgi:beta-lactamase regulating signal transducer with metallopeptidase domain
MNKTSNLAAYTAWVITLVAILAPPALANLGISAVVSAQEAVFALVEEEPQPLTLAERRAQQPGWQA